MLNLEANSFAGVRFALFGFDPNKHEQARSRLVSVGGIDVGEYGPDCTHVIVDKLVYDDPICVAARSDGKSLVNSLWVDHSLDVGVPVETCPIMYRPVKDFNGIPGARGCVMCLTGYQRHDRDDIMTLVGLMGAQFSKPLVANRVTHLICYKFEGEKYELAKKMKKIKLINHRWLEDCLKAWELLPEENYSKSGYELEMESEAKDSEDEMPDHDTKLIQGSPHNLQTKSSVNQNTPVIAGRLPNAEPVGSSTVVHAKDVTLPIKVEKGSDQAKKSISRISQLEPKGMDDGYIDAPNPSSLLNPYGAVSLSTGVDADPPTLSTRAKRLSVENASKLSASRHAKKTSRRSSLSLHQGVVSGNNSTTNDRLTEGKNCPSSHDLENGISAHVPPEIPSSRRKLPGEGGPNCSPSLKRKMIDSADFSPPRFKFQNSNGSYTKQVATEEPVVSINGSCKMSEHTLEDPCAFCVMDDASATPDHLSNKVPHSPEKRSLETKLPISRNLTSDLANGSGRSSLSPFAAPSSSKGKEEQQNQHFISPPVEDIKAVKCGSPIFNATPALDSSTPKSTRKGSSRKTLGSGPMLNAGSSANQKGSINASVLSMLENPSD